MSYGGPTWDTAGELTAGATNTFDMADVTEVGVSRPYHHAWWTYTPATDRVVLIDTGDTVGGFFGADTMIYVYSGATEGAKVYVTSNDDTEDSRAAAVVVTLFAGVTYHILVGTYDSDGDDIVTYRVELAPTTLRPRKTDWLDTFRDRDDNVLVVGSPALLPENPWPEWETDPSWYTDLLLGTGGQRALGRRTVYEIQSTLGGADLLDGADACAWAHATYGNYWFALWNTSTTDASDHGPPVCRPLGGEPGGANEAFTLTARYTLDYHAPAGFTAGSMDAEVDIAVLSPALRYARDNLTERGALPDSLADAIADGVPAEWADSAVREWEPGGVLELLSVEMTGDDQGLDYDPASETTFLINPDVGPTYAGGGTFTSWTKGIPTATDGFTYVDGIDWHDLPAITGFDDLVDDGPDMVIASILTPALAGSPPPSVFAEVSNASRVGFRFTFRSPRYRWTWIEEGVTTVVRQFPRESAGGVGSTNRLWPRPKTGRIAGGYPGGSGK